MKKWNLKLMNVEGRDGWTKRNRKMDGQKNLRGSTLEKSNHIWTLFPRIVRRATHAGNNGLLNSSLFFSFLFWSSFALSPVPAQTHVLSTELKDRHKQKDWIHLDVPVSTMSTEQEPLAPGSGKGLFTPYWCIRSANQEGKKDPELAINLVWERFMQAIGRD